MTTDDVTVNLQQLYGNPLKVTLPWTPSAASPPDEVSWLPGRVYNWAYVQGSPLQAGGDNPGSFNTIDLGAFADGLSVSVAGSASVNGNSQLALRNIGSTTFTVKLTRANGDVLATYTSPTYDAVATTDPGSASNSTTQLGYPFRLAESGETGTTPDVWLTTAGRDPRSASLGPDNLVALDVKNSGTDPTLYKNATSVRDPGRFLDRNPTSGTSYNEDLPLFELPRSPILSLGELQHFYIPGARPFSIGNSWGNGTQLNSVDVGTLFDQFFLSGLVSGVTPTTVNGSLSLPSPLLKPLGRNSATGVAVAPADLQGAPNAQSSKYLLQGGAFNLNSVSPVAWEAVLRAGRFISGTNFNYLDSDPTTGTASDDSTATPSDSTVLANLPTAAFFRFPQSAQEVYKADDGYVQSTTQFGGEVDVLNIPLFRRGIRTLSASDIFSLATKITDAIKARQIASGPFLSLQDFLGPVVSGSPSLLEQAISDASINANVAQVSAQWLTQADIMTALAPILFPRSDTFVIRTYGEAVNPTTGATEGRAWCEATVQRVPEYFDKADAEEVAPAALTSTINQSFGRRFKIVSFRWLTRSDI